MELAGILYKTREAHMQQWKKRSSNGGISKTKTLKIMREQYPEKYNEYVSGINGKISLSMKNYISENGHWWNGKKHSDETKNKTSNSMQGKNVLDRNGQFGKCWIYHLEDRISKSIKKEQLDSYLEQGWLKGRKMSFTAC